MITLPLYPERPIMPSEPASFVDQARARLGEGARVLGWETLDCNPGCARCELSARPRTRICLPPDGEPGGLLVVGEHPTVEDNANQRPFSSGAGKFLRLQVAKHWKGPVAWDTAVKCHPGKLGLKDKHVAQCLPYLRRTIEEVRPTRILAVGGWATYAVTGRAFPVMSTRKGYGYLSDAQTPVFYLMHPVMALRNRFVRSWIEEDVAWALTCPPPSLPPWDAVLRVVETVEDALAAERALMDEAVEGRALAFDCETKGWQRCPGFEIVTLAVCPVGLDEAWVWPREALAPGDPRVAPLLRLLRDPSVAKAGSSVKYDNLAVADRFGVRVEGVTGDALFFRKLQWTDASGDLDHMAELVGMGGHKAEADGVVKVISRALKTGKGAPELVADPEFQAASAAVRLSDEPPKRYAYGLMDPEVRNRYCARDAVATARLIAWQEPELRARPETWAFWETRISRDARAFEQIEEWGIAASFEAAERFRSHVQARLDPIVAEFETLKFNPDSPIQLAKLLFEDLKLPVLKRTPTGKPSTDEEVLDHLKGRAPICGRIVEYRKLDKLRSTYAEPLPGHVRADGRIHANYKVDGTRTGRPSASEPNLLNQPRAETPEGKMLRDCFIAEPGKTLLQADYAQIELRIAAMLSGDKLMREIFESGVDYHLRTAQMIAPLIWNITPEEVTKAHRQQAKPVNFGLLYGLSDVALAAQIGCSVRQAAALRAAILGRFKGLAKWMAERLAETRRTGGSWTWWAGKPARWRSLWQVGDADAPGNSVAVNSAVNAPIQGTASEFCLESVTTLVEWILAEGLADDVKLVLTVYDSIMVEVRTDLVPVVARKMRDVMTGWDSMGVPLVADFEMGPAWGSMEKYQVVAA